MLILHCILGLSKMDSHTILLEMVYLLKDVVLGVLFVNLGAVCHNFSNLF